MLVSIRNIDRFEPLFCFLGDHLPFPLLGVEGLFQDVESEESELDHPRVGLGAIGLCLGKDCVDCCILDVAVSEEVPQDTLTVGAPLALRELE